MQDARMPKFLIVIIALVIIVAFGVVVYMQDDSDEEKGSEATSQDQNTENSALNGALWLEGVGGQTVYGSGEDITVLLYADTSGQEIGGYDAVFDVAPADVELVEAVSLIEGFDMFSTAGDEALSITGIRNLQSNQTFMFDRIPVAEIVLRPVASDILTLNFVFEPGDTSDSNLVTPSSNDILGEAIGMTFYVGETYTLSLNTEVALDDGTPMTLTSVTIPAADCMDCVSTATVSIGSGADAEVVDFELGGLAGVRYATAQTQSYMLEAGDITDTTVTISVSDVSVAN